MKTIKVRCINPKNTGLRRNRIYDAKRSKYLNDCYNIDVGWGLIVDNSIVKEVTGKELIK